jgi:hypothetical protein
MAEKEVRESEMKYKNSIQPFTNAGIKSRKVSVPISIRKQLWKAIDMYSTFRPVRKQGLIHLKMLSALSAR